MARSKHYAEISAMLRRMPTRWRRAYNTARRTLAANGGPVLPDVPTPEQAMLILGNTAGRNRDTDRPFGDQKVPQSVRNEAMHGLRLSYEKDYPGWEFFGIARAIQLVLAPGVPMRTRQRMKRYLDSHAKDKLAPHFGDEERPSKGYMAWLNWGGDAGAAWNEDVPRATYSARTRGERRNGVSEPHRAEKPDVISFSGPRMRRLFVENPRRNPRQGTYLEGVERRQKRKGKAERAFDTAQTAGGLAVAGAKLGGRAIPVVGEVLMVAGAGKEALKVAKRRATQGVLSGSVAEDLARIGAGAFGLESFVPEAKKNSRRRNPDPTDTTAFKRWFGKSKVVDAEGKPLVVYHGTDAEFDIFLPSASPAKGRKAALLGDGFYFTSDPTQAASYGKRVIAAYLRIENPRLQQRGVLMEKSLDQDGTIATGTPGTRPGEYVYVVKSPTQIKSATDNTGAFNPEDPSIYRNPRRSATTAERTDPALWEAVKREVTAGSKGGVRGEWSARKAQLAVALYKQRGGGYLGPKSPRNALAKWTREDWRTRSGEPSLVTGERYLPARAIEALTPAEYAATSRAKRAGLLRDEQFTPQPERIAAKTARYRKNPTIYARDIAKSLAAREPYKKVDLPGYGVVWTDTPEGDDSFPPAIASYAPKDGWLFYKGRNGSEGVIVGSLKDVQKWMLAVDDFLTRYPLATEEPWSEAKHGGAEYVAAATEAARIVFDKFGTPLRRVKVGVSTDPMAPSHPMGADGIRLTNVHRPVKAHFLADRKGTREVEVLFPVKVGAHEASHVGFSLRPDRAHYVIDVLKARQAAGKPYLSDYHALMGHAEGTAEAGAFYTLLPDLLHDVAPEVYDAVAWWFGDGPDPRQHANPARRAGGEAQPERIARKTARYRKNPRRC